jgi:hypothetical protein
MATQLGQIPSLPTATADAPSSTTSAASSYPTRTPQQEAASKWLATLVVFGILGLYALLFVIIAINWIVSRIKREPRPMSASLPPEATERGNGAFLVPTPNNAHDPYKNRKSSAPANFSRPAGNRSRRNTASSAVVPKRPTRPPGLALNEGASRHGSVQSNSSRAVFYNNPGGTHSSNSLHSPLAASQTYSPSGSPGIGTGGGGGYNSRSRASSVSSARFYHEGVTPDAAPQMPPLMYQPGGRW